MHQWIKRSLLFEPEGNCGWMHTHAQVPTALVRSDCLRVYFATRPKQNLSLTTFVDLDLEDLSRILYLHPRPILETGGRGAFDEYGIMPSSVIDLGDQVYLYYSGWSTGGSLPYTNYTGLAISEDGGTTFRKYSPGPIVDRTPFEIYSATSPCVYLEDSMWHMWYSSGTHWLKVGEKLEHTYDLKYAWSTDGKTWVQPGETVIEQRSEEEAITRPTVLKMEDGYHMWFCYRGSRNFRNGGDSYRIGYAYSKDLKSWERDDALAGIELSENGWDSQMMAYPAVVDIGISRIMLYNGNGFGYQGFGYAELEEGN